MEPLIYVEQKEKDEATLLLRGLSNPDIRKRVFINALGAELLMKYLAQEGISVVNVYNMHNIFKIREEFDIADVMLPNIHIDVRVVYDKDVIFVPKSHFENNLVPDVYVVFNMAQDSTHVDFLGFIKPENIDKTKQNSEYYFVDKEKLVHPSEFVDFVRDFEGNTTETFSNKLYSSAISLIDNDITDSKKHELLDALKKSSALREEMIEFDNFEWLSYNASTEDIIDAVTPEPEVIDEFDLFEQKDEFDLEDDTENQETEIEESPLNAEISESLTEDLAGVDAVEETAETTVDVEELLEPLPELPEAEAEEGLSDDIDSEELPTEEDTDNEPEEATTEKEERIVLSGDLAEELETLTEAADLTLDAVNPTEELETLVEIEELAQNLTEPTADLEALAEVEELPQELEEPTAELEEPVAELDEPTEELEPLEEIEEFPQESEEPVAEIEEPTEELEPLEEIEEAPQEVEAPVAELEEPTEELEPLAEVEEAPQVIEEPVAEPLDLQETVTEEASAEEVSNFEEVEETEVSEEPSEELMPIEEINSETDDSDKDIISEVPEEVAEPVEEPVIEIVETPAEEPIVYDAQDADITDILGDIEITEPEPEIVEEPVPDNTTVISSENKTPGEIKLDINTPEKEDLGVLYDNNGNTAKLEAETISIKTPKKSKKAIVVAAAAAVVLAASATYFLTNNNNNKQSDLNDPLTAEEPEAVAIEGVQMAPETPPVDEPQPVPETPQAEEVQQPQSAPPALEVIEPPPPQASAPPKQIEEDKYLDIKKMGWSVPDYVTYNDSFKHYLQTLGKSLRLALSSDLLLATEYPYSNQVFIEIELLNDGTVNKVTVTKSSGSKQIDKIVLQTVKETANVVKPPSGVIVGKNLKMTLKIYL